MKIRKHYWIYALALILLGFAVGFAQDKPIIQPISFSCEVNSVKDNQGNMNGWVLTSDMVYQDPHNVKMRHTQRLYRPEDGRKADEDCLAVHKEFNKERDKARKQRQKIASVPKGGDQKSVEPEPLEKATF